MDTQTLLELLLKRHDVTEHNERVFEVGYCPISYIPSGESYTLLYISRDKLAALLAECLQKGEVKETIKTIGQDISGPPDIFDYNPGQSITERWEGEVEFTITYKDGGLSFSYQVLSKEVTASFPLQS